MGSLLAKVPVSRVPPVLGMGLFYIPAVPSHGGKEPVGSAASADTGFGCVSYGGSAGIVKDGDGNAGGGRGAFLSLNTVDFQTPV